VFWKIQELDMQKANFERKSTHKFCRKLMLLPFLPAEWIKLIFDQIKEMDVAPPIKELMIYIEDQWTTSSQFPITSWAAYKRAFLTNNDVESWHHKLSHQANGAALNMFDLIIRLHEQAQDVVVVCQLISEGLLKRLQRKKYAALHEQISNIWQKFKSRDKNVHHLLNRCSRLNGPCIKM